MFSIGEFSKINRITTKTLRHYDKIGLLKPDKIDLWTGYRYYNPKQLIKIKRILMLKEMGFSLESIKSIITNSENVKKLLEEQATKLKTEIKQNQKKLEKILNFQENIEGGNKMKSDIIIKSLPEVIVASMRTVVDSYDTYFDIVPKMGEYMREVGAVCRDPEYCFTIYHDGEYKENDMDVEICEAVIKKCKENDKVKFKPINYVPEAACILHKGPYSTLEKSYNEIFSWIYESDYEVVDNPRESYIDGIWNKDSPEDWLTEIQIPIKHK